VSRRAPGERSRGRQAVIAVTVPLGLLTALVLQLTVVNRLPLPGGDRPDLVLVLVAAVAARAPALTGALAGFTGGLALDLAPPQAHYAGEYALVFCLAGYGAARAGARADDGGGGRPALTSVVIVAAAALAGEAGKAALGLLLSDPDVTGPAIRHVLPGSVLYDLLLSPVAVALVAVTAGRPAAVARVLRPEFAAATRLSAVFRPASAGAAPGLRLAGSGPVHRRPSWARAQPKLRLSRARTRSSLARTNAAGSPSALPFLAGGRAARLHFSAHAPRTATARPPRAGGAFPAARAGRRRRRWRPRDPGRRVPRTPAPYVSRPYPMRRRGYRRRLLALVGVRR
jgi:rod shape-determining protein MreD